MGRKDPLNKSIITYVVPNKIMSIEYMFAAFVDFMQKRYIIHSITMFLKVFTMLILPFPDNEYLLILPSEIILPSMFCKIDRNENAIQQQEIKKM